MRCRCRQHRGLCRSLLADRQAGRQIPAGAGASTRELAGYWVRSQSVISAYITANVFDRHHAEDILQDVASVVAENFASFDRSQSFVAWTLGIARKPGMWRSRVFAPAPMMPMRIFSTAIPAPFWRKVRETEAGKDSVQGSRCKPRFSF